KRAAPGIEVVALLELRTRVRVVLGVHQAPALVIERLRSGLILPGPLSRCRRRAERDEQAHQHHRLSPSSKHGRAASTAHSANFHRDATSARAKFAETFVPSPSANTLSNSRGRS